MQTQTELQKFFDLFHADDFKPRYKISPTQNVPIERWRVEYNTIRPHSAPGADT